MYRQDLTGEKLGSLTVISYAGHNKGGKRTWRCLCDCGKESIIKTSQLNKQTGNCIHCKMRNLILNRKLPDYNDSKWIDKKFGSLTVLGFAGHKNNKRMYQCLCDCGKESITNSFQLGRRTGTCVHCRSKKTWEPIFEGSVCKIWLTNSDEYAIIDAEDSVKVERRTWALNDAGYVISALFHKSPIWLHRLVMDAPENREVDHIHHNKLDNRKSKLRTCTRMENSWNRTGNPGVFFVIKNKKYRARIMVNGEERYLGEYDNYEKALQVRKEAEIKYYGEFRYK
jgi:hypothetical protein